jgi:hypothetical protein
MQFGYGKKTKKHKKKAKKAAKGDGDASMQDAAPAAADAMVDAVVEPEGQLSAKDKQRRKMELKQALRVKVNTLKTTRCAAAAGRSVYFSAAARIRAAAAQCTWWFSLQACLRRLPAGASWSRPRRWSARTPS